MKSYLYSVLFAFAGITSCVTANCPGYDLKDFRLISFRQGDTLTYVSNRLDTIHLVVSNFYSKGPYEFSSPPDYECNLDTYYQTDKKEDISIKEHITYGMSVQFCNDDEYKITSGNYAKKDDYEMEVSDTVFNDIPCKKYHIKDLSSYRRITKFTKMDYCGIIEFHDQATGSTWRKIR